MANDVTQRFVGKFNLLSRDAVLFHLARDQVAASDVQLLLLAVALEFDDLHAIAQRLGDRVEHVRGRDEKNLRQVKGYVEIVIAECRVLLRIERFQQRRSGVAAEVAADLVDFVEHENRIFGFRTANSLDNLSRQRPDVSAAMAANFRLIVHTAQR